MQVYRGAKCNDYVFDDEATVKEFLVSERKERFHKTYHPVKNQTFHELVQTWGIEEFEGYYLHDYRTLKDDRCHVNEYTTIIYSPETVNPMTRCHEPVPDYIRWMQTDGELHNISLMTTELSCNQDHGTNVQGSIFIPSNIMENAFKA